MNTLLNREVTAVKKDSNNDIIALCGACGRSVLATITGGTSRGHLESYSWPREKKDVINDIENQGITYIVKVQGMPVIIEVVPSNKHGKYLRTKPDHTNINNLDNLPLCLHP